MGLWVGAGGWGGVGLEDWFLGAGVCSGAGQAMGWVSAARRLAVKWALRNGQRECAHVLSQLLHPPL